MYATPGEVHAATRLVGTYIFTLRSSHRFDLPRHRAVRIDIELVERGLFLPMDIICSRCGSKMHRISHIDAPEIIERILGHLGLPTKAPRPAPARAPPRCELDLRNQPGRVWQSRWTCDSSINSEDLAKEPQMTDQVRTDDLDDDWVASSRGRQQPSTPPDHVQLERAVDEVGDGGEVLTKSNKKCYFVLYDHEPGQPTISVPNSFLSFEAAATPELFAQVLATGYLDEIRGLAIDENAKKMASLGDVSSLKRIEYLSIRNSQYQGWTDLYVLSSLKKLHLGYKTKGDLPAGISALTNLDELDISSNGITSLPADLGELSLGSLRLCCKKLSALPLLNTAKIKKLVIDAPLTEIDPNLAQVPDLKIYGLKPAAIKKLTTTERAAFGDRIRT